MNQVDFILNFLKDRNIGAVAPTSKIALKKVFSYIDFSRDLTIVEYGPGNGISTRGLLERMSPRSLLIAIEANPTFAEYLYTIADRRLTIVEGYAQNVVSILAEAGSPPADYIVSSIPFSFFSDSVRNHITRQTHRALAPDGAFVVYQYSFLMKPYMESAFGSVTTGFAPINIPSIFIMKGQKGNQKALR